MAEVKEDIGAEDETETGAGATEDNHRWRGSPNYHESVPGKRDTARHAEHVGVESG